MSPKRRAILLVSAFLLIANGMLCAQQYPVRPIRLLVPVPTGGGLDIIARFIAPPLTEGLGTAVVIDNRAGASGAIAMDVTAHAAPDGYTLMIFSINQIIFSALNKTNYDIYRDFAPVSQISASPYAMVIYPKLPVNSVQEFIAHASANPDKANYGSSGIGTLPQLAAELLAVRYGIKLVHVPYKGVGAAVPDMVAGRTSMSFFSASAVAGLHRAKLLRPLAVTTIERIPMLPDVPTMAESGVPNFIVTQWHGLLAPARTPRAIVDRLYKEIAAAVKRPDVNSKLDADGTQAVGSSPGEFAAHMTSERDRWLKTIKDAGISMQ